MKKYIAGDFVLDRILHIKPKYKNYIVLNPKQNDISYMDYLGFSNVPSQDLISNNTDTYSTVTDLKTSLSELALTINTICYDVVLNVHLDIFNAKDDINNKVLKGTENFSSNPRNVFTLARYKAKLPDFVVDPKTQEEAESLAFDVYKLTSDEINKELELGFSTENPYIFIENLNSLGVTGVIFGDILNKKSLEMVKHTIENSTPKHSFDFIIYRCGIDVDVKFEIPLSTVTFCDFMDTHIDFLSNIQVHEPKEIADFFEMYAYEFNSEEIFFYKVLEYLIITNEITSLERDVIVRLFDVYNDTSEEVNKTLQEYSSVLK